MSAIKFNIAQFLDLLDKNWNLSIDSRRFVSNILYYVKEQNLSDSNSALLAHKIISNAANISLQDLSLIKFHDEHSESETDNATINADPEDNIPINIKTELTAYKSETGRYIIPVEWSVYSTVVVENAANLWDAVQKVNAVLELIPLCSDPEYIDGSYKISADIAEDYINAQEYRTIGNIELTDNIKIWKDGVLIQQCNPDGTIKSNVSE